MAFGGASVENPGSRAHGLTSLFTRSLSGLRRIDGCVQRLTSANEGTDINNVFE
jgi:hypothetical protein